jgi:hypothetical protein
MTHKLIHSSKKAEESVIDKKTAADEFVAKLDEETRSPEEIAAVKAAAESMDMEAVAKHKADGNEYFRKNEFKEACDRSLCMKIP